MIPDTWRSLQTQLGLPCVNHQLNPRELFHVSRQCELWASGSDRPQSVVSRERGWVVLPSRHDNWSPGDPHHREGGSAGPGWKLRNQLLENLH